MAFTPIVCLPEDKVNCLNKDKQNKTPESERIRLVALWQKSKLTQVAFSRRHAINVNTFAGWVSDTPSVEEVPFL